MIWVGGGAGMAPLRAQIMHMTRTLHTTDRELHYFYGARALNEVFYLDDFLKLEKTSRTSTSIWLWTVRTCSRCSWREVYSRIRSSGNVEHLLERPRSSRRHRILHVWSWSDVEGCCRYAG